MRQVKVKVERLINKAGKKKTLPLTCF